MLTDAALKHLKGKDKIYKVTDRDGMYVLVKPSGTLTFRLDYRMNGRRETVTFGKYGPAGLSLARARELCIDAKRAIADRLGMPLAKLTSEQLATLNALLAETLAKPVVWDHVRRHLDPFYRG